MTGQEGYILSKQGPTYYCWGKNLSRVRDIKLQKCTADNMFRRLQIPYSAAIPNEAYQYFDKQTNHIMARDKPYYKLWPSYSGNIKNKTFFDVSNTHNLCFNNCHGRSDAVWTNKGCWACPVSHNRLTPPTQYAVSSLNPHTSAETANFATFVQKSDHLQKCCTKQYGTQGDLSITCPNMQPGDPLCDDIFKSRCQQGDKIITDNLCKDWYSDGSTTASNIMDSYCRKNLLKSACQTWVGKKDRLDQDSIYEQWCKNNHTHEKCGCFYPKFDDKLPGVIPKIPHCFATNCVNPKAYKKREQETADCGTICNQQIDLENLESDELSVLLKDINFQNQCGPGAIDAAKKELENREETTPPTDETNGTDGTNGTNGTDGTNGTNGTDGTDGTETVTQASATNNTLLYVVIGIASFLIIIIMILLS